MIIFPNGRALTQEEASRFVRGFEDPVTEGCKLLYDQEEIGKKKDCDVMLTVFEYKDKLYGLTWLSHYHAGWFFDESEVAEIQMKEVVTTYFFKKDNEEWEWEK